MAFNAIFMQLNNILAAAKRYTDRINRIYEIQNAELALFHKKLEKRNELYIGVKSINKLNKLN